MSDLNTESPFLFVGNVLWLDFVNTKIARDGELVDLLADSTALQQWAGEANLVSESRTQDLDDWEQIFQSAISLRSNLLSLAHKMDHGVDFGSSDLQFVNRLLQDLHPLLTQKDQEWRLVNEASNDLRGKILSQIALSAALLIADGGQQFVHKCESPTCVLYYYDTSKNHKRRWCSMASCGNRHKAAVHYRRQRA